MLGRELNAQALNSATEGGIAPPSSVTGTIIASIPQLTMVTTGTTNTSSKTYVSNTFNAVVSVATGKQVIRLTSVASGALLSGVASANDEWIVDLVTSGGLAITILADGTYSIAGLVGQGTQTFEYQYIHNADGNELHGVYTANVDAVDYSTLVSNTFDKVVSSPAGTQVIKLTSNANGLVIDDEWVVDIVTDGGLPIVISADGTFTVTGISGSGAQKFDWYGLDKSAGYTKTATFTENVDDPTDVLTAPTISVHPQNETLTEDSGQATLTVVGTGNPLPTYQWQLNGGNIIGATGSTYILYGNQLTRDDTGNTYRCVLTNSQGSVISNNSVLTMLELPIAPVITQHPDNNVLTEGSGSVTFTVVASSFEAVTYQWMVFSGVSYIDILGATSASHVVNGSDVTSLADNGNGYICKVTNSAGTSISDSGALFVIAVVDEAPSATMTATEITDTSMNIRFTADEAGTFMMVLLANNSPIPTAEQIKTVTAVGTVRASPVAIMELGTEVVTPLIGLGEYTQYDVYALLIDPEGNERVIGKLDVTTARDQTIPVIVLIGSATMNVPLGSTFVDPGAILTDNVDPDRPISGTGAVSVNTLGSYTKVYNGTDGNGNAALTVNRLVIVYDPADSTNDSGIVDNVTDDIIDEILEDIID